MDQQSLLLTSEHSNGLADAQVLSMANVYF